MTRRRRTQPPQQGGGCDAFTKVAPYYDRLMAGVPYGEWVDYLERLFQELDASPETVLDLATGTGQVAVLLARRGYRVTGVDVSDAMLAVARDKSRQAGLDIAWLHQSAADLDLPARSFDAVVCLYDSLNYLTEPVDLAACFSGVRRCLRPQGVFIFDLNTVHALEAELFSQQDTTSSSLRYRWTSKFDRKTGLSRIEMDFWVPGGERFSEVHCQRAYPVDDVVAMLEAARLEVQGLYEAYMLLPPGPLSSRIFYAARRWARSP